MERCGIPGMSIAVLYKNQLIFAEGLGKRNETHLYTVELKKVRRSRSLNISRTRFTKLTDARCYWPTLFVCCLDVTASFDDDKDIHYNCNW